MEIRRFGDLTTGLQTIGRERNSKFVLGDERVKMIEQERHEPPAGLHLATGHAQDSASRFVAGAKHGYPDGMFAEDATAAGAGYWAGRAKFFRSTGTGRLGGYALVDAAALAGATSADVSELGRLATAYLAAWSLTRLDLLIVAGTVDAAFAARRAPGGETFPGFTHVQVFGPHGQVA